MAASSDFSRSRVKPAMTYRLIEPVSRPMNRRTRFDEIAIMWSPAAASR